MSPVVLAGAIREPGGPAEVALLALVLAAIVLVYDAAAGRGFGLALAVGGALGYVLAVGIALPIAVLLVGCVLLWESRREQRCYRQPVGPFLREGFLVLSGLGLYEVARMASEGGFAPAAANARHLIDFERGLGLFFEPSLQDLVIRNDVVTRLLNGFYSFAFLSITAAVLVGLYFRDRPNYRLFRNCLAISAALAVVTIAVFPVAPPRLMAEAGVTDTVVAMGREHSFANEYAAVPSLHVGWMVLVAYVITRSIGGWKGLALGLPPAIGMSLTVLTTGNHYWLDGVVGSAYSVGPALLLTSRRVSLFRGGTPGNGPGKVLRAIVTAPTISGRARFSVLGLSGLLTYLIAGEIVAPGFTDFWGYMVFQMVVTLALLVGGEVVFARQGGLSWQTHVIAIAECYGDVLGTAGDLYANIGEYDKVTHFLGTAAITSGAFDVMRALARRGIPVGALERRLFLAVALGISAGVGWEVYEFLGDEVFHTARVQGVWDTTNDLFSDTLGAFAAVAVLWRSAREAEPEGAFTAPD